MTQVAPIMIKPLVTNEFTRAECSSDHGRKINVPARQRGMTLLETVLVLVIGLVLVFGILSFSKSTSQSASVFNETKALQAVTAGVKTLYPGSSVYTGLTASMLITGNKVPTNMVNGTSLKHSWGDAVTVAPDATQGYNITYVNVPTAACLEFTTAVGSNYNRTTVGSTDVKTPTTTTVDAAATEVACKANATVSITFNAL